MTNSSEQMFNMRKPPKGQDKVVIGDSTTMTVVGIGKLSVKLTNTIKVTMTNVLYVPDLFVNLISVPALLERNFEVSFKGTNVTIQPPNGKSFTMPRTSHMEKLYSVELQ